MPPQLSAFPSLGGACHRRGGDPRHLALASCSSQQVGIPPGVDASAHLDHDSGPVLGRVLGCVGLVGASVVATILTTNMHLSDLGGISRHHDRVPLPIGDQLLGGCPSFDSIPSKTHDKFNGRSCRLFEKKGPEGRPRDRAGGRGVLLLRHGGGIQVTTVVLARGPADPRHGHGTLSADRLGDPRGPDPSDDAGTQPATSAAAPKWATARIRTHPPHEMSDRRPMVAAAVMGCFRGLVATGRTAHA